MGVEFLVCNNCNDTFPDCGDFESCECGMRWCSLECAEAQGFREELDGFTPKGSRYTHYSSCNYCREDDFSDSELFSYCLNELNLSRDELIEKYKKSI